MLYRGPVLLNHDRSCGVIGAFSDKLFSGEARGKRQESELLLLCWLTHDPYTGNG